MSEFRDDEFFGPRVKQPRSGIRASCGKPGGFKSIFFPQLRLPEDTDEKPVPEKPEDAA